MLQQNMAVDYIFLLDLT